VVKYFKPDGTLWGNIDREVDVSKSIKEAAYDGIGWGWEKAGNWQSGKYTVKAYFNGQYVGESQFEISSTTAVEKADFRKVKFFESGEKYLVEDYRKYSYKFPQLSTRFVNADIIFKNNYYKIEDKTVQITVKYFKPDGTLRGDMKKDVKVGKDIDIATYDYLGWGWKNPGKWLKGIYKVEIYFDGKFVGESKFEVY
jgi:hypothetical protein